MENEIVIKNLPADFYVPELCSEFRRFGDIVSAWVQRTDGSSAEAGLTFEEGSSALEAVKRMDGRRVRGRDVNVTTSYENQRFKKVFVKGFSPTWGEEDLVDAFGQFGPVKGVHMPGGGKPNRYGCVEYESHAAAAKAIAAMDGIEIGGRKLEVGRFRSKAERDHLELNCLEVVEQRLRDTAQRDNLHVKNLPLDMDGEELRRMFQGFGIVRNAEVMRDHQSGKSRGFGFVSFEREEDAARARKKMNGRSVRGDRVLAVNFKEDGKLRERAQRLKSKNEERALRNSQYKARSKSSASLLLPHSVERNRVGRRLHEC